MRTKFFKNPTPAPSAAAPWSKRQTATKPLPVSESVTASLPRTKQAEKTGYKPVTAQYGNPYQEAVIDLNRIQNNGQVKCANCGIETTPAKQSIKNTTPTSNERQVDHVIPKSKGGKGTPKNGQA